MSKRSCDFLIASRRRVSVLVVCMQQTFTLSAFVFLVALKFNLHVFPNENTQNLLNREARMSYSA